MSKKKTKAGEPVGRKGRGTVFGDRMRTRRNALGLSQRDLAERAGISQPAVMALETGRSKKTHNVIAIAAALETTAEWLAGNEGARRANGPDQSADHNLSLNVEAILKERPKTITKALKFLGFAEAGKPVASIDSLAGTSGPIEMPVPKQYAHCARYMRVRGSSMNLKGYVDGTQISLIPFAELTKRGRYPKSGDDVVVTRHIHGGTEVSLKEYWRNGDRAYLRSHSDDPAHKHAPIPLPVPGVAIPDDEQIRVEYLVFDSLTPRAAL